MFTRKLVDTVLLPPPEYWLEEYVVVTCSYYNTGNYATIEDRTTDDK